MGLVGRVGSRATQSVGRRLAQANDTIYIEPEISITGDHADEIGVLTDAINNVSGSCSSRCILLPSPVGTSMCSHHTSQVPTPVPLYAPAEHGLYGGDADLHA